MREAPLIEREINAKSPQVYVRTTARQRCLTALGVIFLIVAALVYGSWRLKLTRNVQEKAEAISRAGYPTNTQQLDQWYTTVPADQNVALRFLKAASKISEPATNYENQFRIWISDTNLLSAIPTELDPWATRNAAAVPDLQAISAGKSRYPVDLSRVGEAEFPHLKKIRNAALLSAVHAMQCLRQNDLQTATALVLLICRLADSLTSEPAFVAQARRWRTEQIACSCLKQIFTRGGLNAPACEQLSASLLKAEQTNGIIRAWLGERANIVPVLAIAYPLRTRARHEPFQGFFPFIGQAERDLALCLDGIETRLRIASLCRPESFQLAKKQDAYEAKALRRNLAFVAAIALTPCSTLERARASQLAMLRSARTAVAIEQYRASHKGALPHALVDLVPQFLSTVPIDPCNGEPLRFRRQVIGYVVYSVGLNGVDDGGSERVVATVLGTPEPADITFTVTR